MGRRFGMEETIYVNGNVAVSNARVQVGNRTYAVQNLASVEIRKTKGKMAPGIIAAVVGFALLFSGEGGLIAFGLVLVAAGTGLAYLGAPKHQVVVVSNANQREAVFAGTQAEAARLSSAISEAMVFNQSGARKTAPPNWVPQA